MGICPKGLVCGADDVCRRPGSSTADAGPAADAAPDAMPVAGFSRPERVAVIDFTITDVEISGDDLEIIVNGAEIRGAVRADRDAEFPPLTPVGVDNSINDPELSSDRLTLWVAFVADVDDDIHVATRAAVGDDWGPLAAEADLDSDGDDFGMTVTADGQRAMFASNRAGDTDLWATERAGDGWTAPVNVAEVNTGVFEGNPELSADGLELFFDRRVDGLRKLHVARRPDLVSPFSEPEPVVELNAAGANDHDASITDDGRVIYFVSDRGGASRVYRAERQR